MNRSAAANDDPPTDLTVDQTLEAQHRLAELRANPSVGITWATLKSRLDAKSDASRRTFQD